MKWNNRLIYTLKKMLKYNVCAIAIWPCELVILFRWLRRFWFLNVSELGVIFGEDLISIKTCYSEWHSWYRKHSSQSLQGSGGLSLFRARLSPLGPVLYFLWKECKVFQECDALEKFYLERAVDTTACSLWFVCQPFVYLQVTGEP